MDLELSQEEGEGGLASLFFFFFFFGWGGGVRFRVWGLGFRV